MGVKPFFFIIGIVNEPVVAVLAIGEPEIIPKKPEETTETLAGPPEYFPARIVARSKSSPECHQPKPVNYKKPDLFSVPA